MAKSRYYGFQFCNFIPVDNREYHQKLLKGTPGNKKIQRAVELDKLIEPGKSYTRLVAHKVAVYKVKEPCWNSRGRFSVPYGEFETIVEVDFGEELITAMTGTREVVVEEKAEHYFPDGTFIKGVRKKLVPGKSQLDKVKDFFEIEHDLEERGKREGEFTYRFEIDRKRFIDSDNPLEIYVETYHKIGDIVLHPTKKDIALLARYDSRKIWDRWGWEKTFIEYRLIYRKTSPNLIKK